MIYEAIEISLLKTGIQKQPNNINTCYLSLCEALYSFEGLEHVGVNITPATIKYVHNVCHPNLTR